MNIFQSFQWKIKNVRQYISVYILYLQQRILSLPGTCIFNFQIEENVLPWSVFYARIYEKKYFF